MIKVIKNSGRLEPFDAEKINEMVAFGCEGLDAAPSAIAMRAQLSAFDGIATSQIQKELVDAARDLATVDEPDYLIAAGRMMMSNLRKKVYGQFEPFPLYDIIYENIELGKYDKDILEMYDHHEIDYYDSVIKHERDMFMPQAAAMTFVDKYLIKDKITSAPYETPQVALMLIAMCLLSKRPNRKERVVNLYEKLSTNKISFPSPIMAGVRSPTKQFSSCCLIDSDDDLDALNATASAIVKYASKRAGIGINGGRIRAQGSPVRGGEISHTGCINFFKYWQAALHSCSQGGLRGASGTLYYPWWHLESEDLLVLKNNKGTESNRVRHLDYGFQINRLFLERVKRNQSISLFSPSDVGNMYEYFFTDQDKFDELYHKFEADPKIRKKTIKAVALMTLFANERAATGRIYPNFVDNMNDYSAFIKDVAPVYMSNLCLEIALPTKPMTHINSPAGTDGEIALCTLAAFNLGEMETEKDIEEAAYTMVESLDELIDYQDYPVNAAMAAKLRRALGVGIINYAYWLAKNKFKYSDRSGNNETHELMEMIQFYLMRASMQLAKEKGACELFHETKYSLGIMPIDLYKKDVDAVHTAELKMDWDSLRADVLQYGMRNSTLTALMPAETSAAISNATNGIEPPRGAISIKAGKDGNMKLIVPSYTTLKDNYEFLWDIPENTTYLEKVGIMQKFVDQAISANTKYDPSRFEGGMVPMKVILRDIFLAYKLGCKTMYYHNTRDNRGKETENHQHVEVLEETLQYEEDAGGCSSGACNI
ncbi:ribonucleotide reductase alpha subunit [Alishewanella phage vB_AspM_Slickus01]|nr:ribonucleotide reductase alpha subunit [Alishewanella phage vB_AspM_Slickus01]